MAPDPSGSRRFITVDSIHSDEPSGWSERCWKVRVDPIALTTSIHMSRATSCASGCTVSITLRPTSSSALRPYSSLTMPSDDSMLPTLSM